MKRRDFLTGLAAIVAPTRLHAQPKSADIASEARIKAREELGAKISSGLEELKEERGAHGYRKAYGIFISAYNDSHKRLSETNHDEYRGFAIVSLMQAASVLLEHARVNIVEPRPIGDADTTYNLKRALEHYAEALKLNSPFRHSTFVSAKSLGFRKIADEKLIRKRAARAYEELISLTIGEERESYRKSLLQTYRRLAEITKGDEKAGYLSKLK